MLTKTMHVETATESVRTPLHRTDSRLDFDNVSIDKERAHLGACGFIHLASGRVCGLRRGHAGGCEFTPHHVEQASTTL